MPLLAGGAVVAALAIAAGAAVVFSAHRSGGEPQQRAASAAVATAMTASTEESAPLNTQAPPSSAAPASASSVPSPPPTPIDDRRAAIVELNELADEGAATHPLDGRWVDQVASKFDGIRDPLQTTADGSHVFTATDVLAESERMRDLVDDPDEVFVLRSTALSSRWVAPTGAAYWITFIDGAFGSKADARAWCAAAFSDLSGADLQNACLPRRLARLKG